MTATRNCHSEYEVWRHWDVMIQLPKAVIDSMTVWWLCCSSADHLHLMIRHSICNRHWSWSDTVGTTVNQSIIKWVSLSAWWLQTFGVRLKYRLLICLWLWCVRVHHSTKHWTPTHHNQEQINSLYVNRWSVILSVVLSLEKGTSENLRVVHCPIK